MARNTGNSGDANRDDAASRRAQERRDENARQGSGGNAMRDEGSRDRYRDDDDQRDRLGADERAGTNPDTKHEAQGSARANVGNTAHDQKDRDLKDRDEDRNRRERR